MLNSLLASPMSNQDCDNIFNLALCYPDFLTLAEATVVGILSLVKMMRGKAKAMVTLDEYSVCVCFHVLKKELRPRLCFRFLLGPERRFLHIRHHRVARNRLSREFQYRLLAPKFLTDHPYLSHGESAP